MIKVKPLRNAGLKRGTPTPLQRLRKGWKYGENPSKFVGTVQTHNTHLLFGEERNTRIRIDSLHPAATRVGPRVRPRRQFRRLRRL